MVCLSSFASDAIDSVMVRNALSNGSNRQARVQLPDQPNYLCQDYGTLCLEIKFSGRHTGFDGVLLRLLANTGFSRCVSP